MKEILTQYSSYYNPCKQWKESNKDIVMILNQLHLLDLFEVDMIGTQIGTKLTKVARSMHQNAKSPILMPNFVKKSKFKIKI